MTTKSAGRRDLLDRVIRAHRPSAWNASLHYIQMIECVRANSSLLSPRSFRSRSKTQLNRSTDRCVRAISRMATFFGSMIRSPYSWIPEGEPVHSLSKHLFAKFDVPEFVHRAWFGELEEIRILLDMARGISPRKAIANSGLNSRLSRKAAHCFANAPDRFGVFNTIRWAQAIGLGASERLAEQIVKACDGLQFEEDFWLEMLRFLIYACNVSPGNRERSVVPPDEQELGEIINFVWQQKYVGASNVLGFRVHHDVPLQPNLTFRGRTLRTFRRHMSNWRNEIDLPIRTPIEFAIRNRIWQPSGFQTTTFRQNETEWTFVELLDSLQLRVEGGKMRHCVGRYAGACLSGRSSIWSLRKSVDSVEQPVVTIEVWRQCRRIVQMKARRNAEPTEGSTALIRRWAKLNDLQMD